MILPREISGLELDMTAQSKHSKSFCFQADSEPETQKFVIVLPKALFLSCCFCMLYTLLKQMMATNYV